MKTRVITPSSAAAAATSGRAASSCRGPAVAGAGAPGPAQVIIDCADGSGSGSTWQRSNFLQRQNLNRLQRRGKRPIFRLPIRIVLPLLSIITVAGAISFTWAFTFIYANRDIKGLTQALLQEAMNTSRQAIQGFLQDIDDVSSRLASIFDTGRLSRAEWREALRSMSLDVDLVPSMTSHLVRFADGAVFGVRPCKSDIGATQACQYPEVFIGNGTHRFAYVGDKNGQPLALKSTVLFLGSPILEKVAASEDGAVWSDLQLIPADIPTVVPLDRVRIQFAVGFGSGRRVSDTPLPPGLELPVGIPPPPRLAAPSAPGPSSRPSSGARDLAGIVIMVASVGVLSAALQADSLAPHGLLILTDTAGTMVASSTGEPSHLVDAAFRPIRASESPDPLTRELFAQGALLGEGGAVGEFSWGGESYFVLRAPISARHGLNWHLAVALDGGALAQHVQQSILVVSVANAAWLVLAVVAAALLATGIARPIDHLYESLSALLESLRTMAGYIAKQSPSEAPPPPLPTDRALEGAASAYGSHGPARVLSSRGLQLQEFSRFGPLLKDVHARFDAFLAATSHEAQLQTELRVRAEQTKRMLNTLSHEMRTPLNGVVGSLDLVLYEGGLPPEAETHLRTAAHCAEHLLALISSAPFPPLASCFQLRGPRRDLLDLQRMASSELRLRQEPVDLREAIAGVLRMLEPQSRARRVPAAVELNPSLPHRILTDPDRLVQILLNLVGNALKYSGEDAGPIDVRASASEAAGMIRFEVQDHGRGIPPEAQPLLFSPFYRVQSPGSASDPGGTGLGLAICKEIVERLGGEIGFVSETGPRHGSTFFFTLPLIPCPSEAPPQSRPPPSAPPSVRQPALSVAALEPPDAPTPLAGKSYLVADDDVVARRVTAATLASSGARVQTASDGARALALFEAAAAARPRDRPFDAVLLDLEMPGLNGPEAARAIRAMEERLGLPRCPLLALTGHSDAESEERCKVAGCDAFLAKPVRRPVLYDTLARLEAAAARGDPAPPSPPVAAQEAPRRRSLHLAGVSVEVGRPAALVADDVEVNRRILRALLERKGFLVEAAADGEEAVHAFEARARAGRPFAAVLLDVDMPKLDGCAAAQSIRAFEARTGLPRTPLCACTAVADEARTRASGMDAHIAKPVRREALRAALRACGVPLMERPPSAEATEVASPY